MYGVIQISFCVQNNAFSWDVVHHLALNEKNHLEIVDLECWRINLIAIKTLNFSPLSSSQSGINPLKHLLHWKTRRFPSLFPFISPSLCSFRFFTKEKSSDLLILSNISPAAGFLFLKKQHYVISKPATFCK